MTQTPDPRDVEAAKEACGMFSGWTVTPYAAATEAARIARTRAEAAATEPAVDPDLVAARELAMSERQRDHEDISAEKRREYETGFRDADLRTRSILAGIQAGRRLEREGGR